MQNAKYQTVIIGGGIAGMQSAIQLQKFGIKVLVIEKENQLGGHLNQWFKVFPGFRPAEEVTIPVVSEMEDRKIQTLLGAEVLNIETVFDNYIVKTNTGLSIEAESLILATGFRTFDPKKKEEYGYGIYPNVFTSVDIENRFKNHVNGIDPKRIALIHCVGSRDEKVSNFHCSKVCCVSAVKQAIELKEHYPAAEILCLYMDLRMYDNGFEELYREAQIKYGIKFVRGRLSECSKNIEGNLVLKVQDTLAGLPMKITVDQLVLMVGKEAAPLPRCAQSIEVNKASHHFIQPVDAHLLSNQTSQPGIFCCGSASGPKTIQESTADAKSAALSIIDYLNRK
jgi:heterodisulfide reductase subunit A